MKKAIMIFMAISTLGILSCKKTDTTATATTAYDGKWSLVSYNPSPLLGAASANTYGMGDIEWDFDGTAQTVNVSVNATVANNPLNAGAYTFLLGNNACNYGTNQYFTTSNDVDGVLVLDSVANNKIKITAQCVDGAILEFER